MGPELNLQLNLKTNSPQQLYSFPYAAFPLLETPVDALLIWKCNLPKDITGMEINNVITGWERGQMRVLQDGRLEMDLLKLDGQSKDTPRCLNYTLYLISVIQWEPPWKRHDSHLFCARGALPFTKVWFVLWEENMRIVEKTLSSCFCGLGCSKDLFIPSFCKERLPAKPYLIWAAKATLLSLFIKVTLSTPHAGVQRARLCSHMKLCMMVSVEKRHGCLCTGIFLSCARTWKKNSCLMVIVTNHTKSRAPCFCNLSTNLKSKGH